MATSTAVRSLFATVERYPEVRSAANVMALQDEIERLEAMIADRRELYNDQVYRYNTRIAQVPAVILAALIGWRARPFFEASDAERTRPAAGLGGGPAVAAEAEAAAGARQRAGDRRDPARPHPPRRDRVVGVGAAHGDDRPSR